MNIEELKSLYNVIDSDDMEAIFIANKNYSPEHHFLRQLYYAFPQLIVAAECWELIKEAEQKFSKEETP